MSSVSTCRVGILNSGTIGQWISERNAFENDRLVPYPRIIGIPFLFLPSSLTKFNDIGTTTLKREENIHSKVGMWVSCSDKSDKGGSI